MIENLLRLLFRHQDIVHQGSLYLRRFLLTPSLFGWELMLHKICRPDVDVALHDHPWDFAVLCLSGGYIEQVFSGGRVSEEALAVGQIRFRSSEHTHRIAYLLDGAAWTLVLHAPKTRIWGFWDVAATPPRFTAARDYFKPGYDAAAAPARGIAART